MSQETTLAGMARVANLTTVFPEDDAGIAHQMSGAISFGPFYLADGKTSTDWIWGTDIDRHFREAGWTLIGKSGAAGFLSFHFFIPDQHRVFDPKSGTYSYPNDAPLFEMGILSDDSGDFLQLFNSFITKPPVITTAWEKGGVTWIPLGETAQGTVENIAEAIYGQAFFPGDGTGATESFCYFPVDDFKFVGDARHVGSPVSFFTVAQNVCTGGKVYESTAINGVKLRLHFSTNDPNSGNIQITVAAWTQLDDGTSNCIGQPVVFNMKRYGDYVFFIDPYSFYMASISDAHLFAGDTGTRSRVFVTTPNILPARLPHTPFPPFPQIAIATADNIPNVDWQLLVFGEPSWWIGNLQILGSSSVHDETGVSFAWIRNGPQPMFHFDDADVVDSARMTLSFDDAGALGTSTGPMAFLGQMWNCLQLERDLGGVYVPFAADYSFPISASDAKLPKVWRSLFRQVGNEGVYIFRGSQGTVLIAPVDYYYVNSTFTFNALTQIGLKVLKEWNLFVDAHSIEGAYVDFAIAGGSGIYSWTIGNLPPGWRIGTPHAGPSSFRIESDSPPYNGSWTINISAVDSGGLGSALQYRMVVGSSSVLIFSNNILGRGLVGIPYFIWGGRGGTANIPSGHHLFELISGNLPTGLHLDAESGAVWGTPIAAGDFPFTVKITIDDGTTTTITIRTFRISIDS